MKRFLLDTGILSDFINHRRGVDIRVRECSGRGDASARVCRWLASYSREWKPATPVSGT